LKEAAAKELEASEQASGKNMRKFHTIFGMKWCINGMK
jgi:hypothetical protein